MSGYEFKKLVTMIAPLCSDRNIRLTMTGPTDSTTDFQYAQAPSVSISEVLLGVRRRSRLILIVTILAFVCGMLIVRLATPVYTTEALVLIEDLETPLDRIQQGGDQQRLTIDDRIVQSQISVLKSLDFMERVVANLQLEERPEFNGAIDDIGLKKQLMLKLGFGEDPRLKTPQERAVSGLADNLVVYQLPESNVVGIKYTSPNSKTATDVTNTLAELYVTSTRESQQRPAMRAREWLADQVGKLSEKVQNAEAEIEAFRASAGLLEGTSSTLGAQAVSELNSQITVAEAARVEAQARADAIRGLLAAKGTVDGSSDVMNSPLIQRLQEQRTVAARRVADLSPIYLANHPRMKAAQSELENVDREIRREALKVVSALEDQAKIAAARERSLRDSLERQKSLEANANADEVKLKVLERQAAADRALLETLLGKYADASVEQDLASQPGRARIIQQAPQPVSPSFPKPGPMVALMTLAGFLISLGVCFLVEIMQAASRLARPAGSPSQGPANLPLAAVSTDRVVRPDPPLPAVKVVESEPVTGLRTETIGGMALSPPTAVMAEPVEADAVTGQFAPSSFTTIVALPSLAHEDDLLGIMNSGDDGHPANRAIVEVGDWVWSGMKHEQARRICLASLGGRPADAAFATIALARRLAAGSYRVILVDIARDPRQIDRIMGLPEGPGLSEFLAGLPDIESLVSVDPASGLHILRIGGDRAAVNRAILEQRLDKVLGELAGTYDAVLIHGGEADGWTAAVARKSDAAIILAAPARMQDASAAIASLQKAGVKKAGIVELLPQFGLSAALQDTPLAANE